LIDWLILIDGSLPVCGWSWCGTF